MKTFYSLLFIVFSLVGGYNGLAKPISPVEAKKFAHAFFTNLENQNSARLEDELTLVVDKKMRFFGNNTSARKQDASLYYVFNYGKSGFIIVSADDALDPVIAYSTEGSFKIGNQPDHFVKWMGEYENRIREHINNPAARTAKHPNWEKVARTTTVVSPLIQAKWNQSPHYNALCPFDVTANERAVTGCVATAMAMLMKYHEHPKQGVGSLSYNEDDYGTLSASFGTTTYNWDNMPNTINSTNSDVAILNYQAGVSVSMNYGVNSSGADGAIVVAPALNKYFKYEAEIAYKSDYTQQAWLDLLKSELDQGRPMYYEGLGNGSGHAFICDGYDSNDFFHFNWGWGGLDDGYYNVNFLDPPSQGIGGGSGSYNNNQKIVYGIQPKPGTNSNIEVYSDIKLNHDLLYYGDTIGVSVDVANLGVNEFTGYVGAMIYNDDNFIEVIDSTRLDQLKGGYFVSLDLTNSGLFQIVPGDYSIALISRPENGDWEILNAGSYANKVDVVIQGYVNDITLSQSIDITTAEIRTGEALEINTNISNRSDNTLDYFKGSIYVGIYDLDGFWVQDVDSLQVDSLPAGYTFSEPLFFENNNIQVEPGSYILAVTTVNQDDEFDVVARGDFQNPKLITVQAPKTVEDIYEDNNSEENAFLLTYSEKDFGTTGANIHIGQDNDFYKLELPEGYSYELEVRVQDGYDSDDEFIYTNDVLISYRTDTSDWSLAYDTYVEENLELAGGQALYFWVSPYFSGQTGTYDLSIRSSRTEIVEEKTLTLNSLSTKYSTNDPVSISWDTNIEGTVTISLLLEGELITQITEVTASDQTYIWSIPDWLGEGDNYSILVTSTDDSSVSATSNSFGLSSITSVADQVDQSIELFPNPFTKRISVLSNHKKLVAISLISLEGKLIKTSFQRSIETNTLKQGIYILRCTWQDNSITWHKVIKE